MVPGQYLGIDPKGRAIMIAAVEKQKFVYIMNRDTNAKLTISSPLEAHRSNHIVFDTIGVDVGYENPIFAAIELDHDEVDHDPSGNAIRETQKMLTFYELDLGLNHVVRKSSDPVARSAHRLIAVPGGSDGPGGVLVCAKDQIIYRHYQDHPEVKAFFPRRPSTAFTKGDGTKDFGVYIISHTSHKLKDNFFILVQTELGDIFRISLDISNRKVEKVNIKYFDTISPSHSMCVLKSGLLFSASEVGNHYLYQFQGVGDDDEDVTFALKENANVTHFLPRPLKNLVLIDELKSAAPILDLQIENVMKDEVPNIYCLTGKGPRASLRTLKHGIAVNEIGVSRLKVNPTNVWTVKSSSGDQYDKYIIVSFADSTIVLSVDETIEQLTESDPAYGLFLLNTTTLNVGRIGDDALIQIYPEGIRHIRGDGRIQEWRPPGGKKIVQSCLNDKQVAIALNGGDLYYFEIDRTQKLVEIEKLELSGKEIVSLAIQSVPAGRQRGSFLAAADNDNKLRIYSLDPADCLKNRFHQQLPAKAISLAFVDMFVYGSHQSFLAVGTVSGIFMRSRVEYTGQLTDNRKKFLGIRPVKLVPIKVEGENALLCLSSRTWLLYSHQKSIRINPLAYGQLEGASTFESEQCTDGVICVTKDRLRIFTPERLGEIYSQTEIPLSYTPRQSSMIPHSKHMIIIESDHNAYSLEDVEKIRAQYQEYQTTVEMQMEKSEEEEEEEEEGMSDASYGVPKPGPGQWASCIRLLDLTQGKTLDLIQLDNNECAVSVCTVTFKDHSNQLFVCVGTAKDLVLLPKRKCSQGYIRVYKVIDQGRKLELLETKLVDNIPGAMTGHQGRLLVGVGNSLKMFDLGKIKGKLIRKCENSQFPNHIVTLSTVGERIIVGDIQESFQFVRYNRTDNVFDIFTDDTVPRWITSCEVLDYNTIAGTDKFGNIFLLRIPDKVSLLENDPTGSRFQWEEPFLNGAPYRLDCLCNFYVGEVVTRIKKVQMTPGASEFLLYTTISGTVGALIPLSIQQDVDFFTLVEMYMRQEAPPLCGRDHLAFRSLYFPSKNVADGDLCEQYSTLSIEKQKNLADNLERTPVDIQKKIEDTRDSI